MGQHKAYSYTQGKLIPIFFERQILPGTFEYTLSHLLRHEVGDKRSAVFSYQVGHRADRETNSLPKGFFYRLVSWENLFRRTICSEILPLI